MSVRRAEDIKTKQDYGDAPWATIRHKKQCPCMGHTMVTGDPITPAQLKREAKRLAGADILLRWHRNVAATSGGLILCYNKEVTVKHLDEWITRLGEVYNQMQGFREELRKIEAQQKPLKKAKKGVSKPAKSE